MIKLIHESAQLLAGNMSARISNTPLTGENIPWMLIIILGLSAIAAAIYFFTKKKKDHDTENDV